MNRVFLLAITCLLSTSVFAQKVSKRDFKKIILPQYEAGNDVTSNLLSYCINYSENDEARALLNQSINSYSREFYLSAVSEMKKELNQGYTQISSGVDTIAILGKVYKYNQSINSLIEIYNIYSIIEPKKVKIDSSLSDSYFYPIKHEPFEEDFNFYFSFALKINQGGDDYGLFLKQCIQQGPECFKNTMLPTNSNVAKVIGLAKEQIPKPYLDLIEAYNDIKGAKKPKSYFDSFFMDDEELITLSNFVIEKETAKAVGLRTSSRGILPRISNKEANYWSETWKPTIDEFVLNYMSPYYKYYKALETLPVTSFDDQLYLRLLENRTNWKDAPDIIDSININIQENIYDFSTEIKRNTIEGDEKVNNRIVGTPAAHSFKKIISHLEGDEFDVYMEYEVKQYKPEPIMNLVLIEIKAYSNMTDINGVTHKMLTRVRRFDERDEKWRSTIYGSLRGHETMYTYEEFINHPEVFVLVKEEKRPMDENDNRDGFFYHFRNYETIHYLDDRGYRVKTQHQEDLTSYDMKYEYSNLKDDLGGDHWVLRRTILESWSWERPKYKYAYNIITYSLDEFCVTDYSYDELHRPSAKRMANWLAYDNHKETGVIPEKAYSQRITFSYNDAAWIESESHYAWRYSKKTDGPEFGLISEIQYSYPDEKVYDTWNKKHCATYKDIDNSYNREVHDILKVMVINGDEKSEYFVLDNYQEPTSLFDDFTGKSKFVKDKFHSASKICVFKELKAGDWMGN